MLKKLVLFKSYIRFITLPTAALVYFVVLSFLIHQQCHALLVIFIRTFIQQIFYSCFIVYVSEITTLRLLEYFFIFRIQNFFFFISKFLIKLNLPELYTFFCIIAQKWKGIIHQHCSCAFCIIFMLLCLLQCAQR